MPATEERTCVIIIMLLRTIDVQHQRQIYITVGAHLGMLRDEQILSHHWIHRATLHVS